MIASAHTIRFLTLLVMMSYCVVASAWQGRCSVLTPAEAAAIPELIHSLSRTPTGPECASDADRLKARYFGEHFKLCLAAFQKLYPNKPAAEVDGGIDLVAHGGPFYMSLIVAGGLPTPYGGTIVAPAEMSIDKRKLADGFNWFIRDVDPKQLEANPFGTFHPCEYAELADYSIDLADYAEGLPSTRCPPGEDCRSNLSIGMRNSNHFGDQAAEAYSKYHDRALNLARLARTVAGVNPSPNHAGYDTARFVLLKAIALYRMAMAYELYGQHYLQDLWAAGHMWNRWGSIKLSDFPTPNAHKAILVAVGSGIVHGTEGGPFALLAASDLLSSPPANAESPATRWGFVGDGARYSATGDAHLAELLVSPEYAEQRKWLLECSSRGIAEIMTEAWQGLPSPDTAFWDKCLHHYATNKSMAASIKLPLKSTTLGTIYVTPHELKAVINRTSSLSGVSATDITTTLTSFGVTITEVLTLLDGLASIAVTFGATANTSPDTLEMARRPPRLLNMGDGSLYLASLQSTVDFSLDLLRPALNWSMGTRERTVAAGLAGASALVCSLSSQQLAAARSMRGPCEIFGVANAKTKTPDMDTLCGDPSLGGAAGGPVIEHDLGKCLQADARCDREPTTLCDRVQLRMKDLEKGTIAVDLCQPTDERRRITSDVRCSR